MPEQPGLAGPLLLPALNLPLGVKHEVSMVEPGLSRPLEIASVRSK
jgi:hypothetical protein